MTLKDYIEKILQVSVSAAARDYAANTKRAVHSETFRTWVNGGVIPRPEEMVYLYEWSLGHVTPNDFYDLPGGPSGQTPEVSGSSESSATSGALSLSRENVSNLAPVAHSGNGYALPGQLSILDMPGVSS